MTRLARALRLGALVWPVLLACGDDAGSSRPPPDAATPDAADPPDASSACTPEAPAAPALPQLTPCPAGWLERAPEHEGAPETCEAFAGDVPATCSAVDEAAFPGEPGCTRVGTACPAGDWADELPSTGVRYVRPGSDASVATGRRDRPFATIGAATSGMPPGTILALAKGTYDERVQLRDGLTLWGACVAETLVTLRSPPSPGIATVLAYGADVVLRNLRVSGGSVGAVVVTNQDTAPGDPSHSLHLEGVVVEGGRSRGVRVDSAALLTAHELVVRDGVPSPDATLDGSAGIAVSGGSRVELERVVVDRAPAVALDASGDGTTVRCTDCLLARTTYPDPAGPSALGVRAIAGARVELAHVALRENGYSLYARDGGSLEGTDVVVADGVAVYGAAYAVAAFDGGRVALARVRLDRAMDRAIEVTGAEVVLEDLVVRDTRGRDEELRDGAGRLLQGVGDLGLGLVAHAGARVEVTRGWFARQRELGLLLTGPFPDEPPGAPPRVSLTDVAVLDSQPDPGGANGRGIQVQNGAELDASRVSIERTFEIALGVYEATAHATDLTVREVRQTACEACGERWGGLGVCAYYPGSLDVERFVVEDASLAGAQIALGAVASLRAGWVRRSSLGVALQTPELGAAEALSCVRFDDVTDEVQSRELAVPPPVGSLPP